MYGDTIESRKRETKTKNKETFRNEYRQSKWVEGTDGNFSNLKPYGYQSKSNWPAKSFG